MKNLLVIQTLPYSVEEDLKQHLICDLHFNYIYNPVDLYTLNWNLPKYPNQDFIFLMAHSDQEEISLGSEKISWSEFGQLLDKYSTINQNTKLLLSSCEGGTEKVKKYLFDSCPSLQHIVGSPIQTQGKDFVFFNQILIDELDNGISLDDSIEQINLKFKLFFRHNIRN